MSQVTLRDGSTVLDPRLGRLPQPDPNNKKFSVRKILDISRPLRSYTWSITSSYILDQGMEGSCVGHGFAHEITARPVVYRMTHEDALRIYHRAQQLDQWEGEDYEGTSVLAGAKAATEMGHYKEYRWAFTEKEMAVTVAWAGPVVIGINWYEGMFFPDAAGFVRPTGAVAGGHCVMINGINVKHDCYQLVNSWGLGWGDAGRAFISRPDMGRLIKEDGECCLPMRIRVK